MRGKAAAGEVVGTPPGRDGREQALRGRPRPDRPVHERYALVIPAHNERATIRDIAERALGCLTHVIVVDDGSVDGTGRAVEGLPVTLLRNTDNLGKAASLWRGFQVALRDGAEAVITLDGDGQHAPEDIPRLVAASEWFPGCVVIGARRRAWSTGTFWRVIANRIADFWVSWAAGYVIEDTQSGFRIYPGTLINQAQVDRGSGNGFVFESEILIEGARLGYGSIPVPIDSPSQPFARPSHFRPARDIWAITRMVAWRLLSRGMYPRGLYRSLCRRRTSFTAAQRPAPPGLHAPESGQPGNK